MNRGTIIYHNDLVYKDGEHGKKLLIILNNSSGTQPYIWCKTTSKSKYGLSTPGCYSKKNVFILNPVDNCFPKKTWVQFHEINEFTNTELLSLKFKGKVKIISNLPDKIIKAIVECIKNSPDISKYHISLL